MKLDRPSKVLKAHPRDRPERKRERKRRGERGRRERESLNGEMEKIERERGGGLNLSPPGVLPGVPGLANLEFCDPDRPRWI